MGAKKDLFLAVKGKILSTEIIKHVAIFNSQFQQMEKEDTFLFPCVFIEFLPLDWTTKAQGLQEAEVVLRLHVGLEALKDNDTDILDLLETLHEYLQNFNVADLFNPLLRIAEEPDTEHDNVIVWTVDYSTLLSDNSGNKNAKLVKTTIADLEVTPESSVGFTAPRLKE
jgi:hypothetical protein